MADILYILPFAFFAGLIDAIAGGGGLIQIPGMMLIFPNMPIATLLGSNKLASACGTAVASTHYLRTLKIDFKTVLPSIIGAFVLAMAGAKVATMLDNHVLRPLVFVLLLGIGIYTLCNRGFGLHEHKTQLPATRLKIYCGIIGAVIGFYDGFFGPGTGSFLIICFVGWLGFQFLQGSAFAKLTNLSSNVAAMIFFAASHHVAYRIAVPMAVFNILGNLTGAHLAIKKGSSFVRMVFLIVIAGILVQFAWQMGWWRHLISSITVLQF